MNSQQRSDFVVTMGIKETIDANIDDIRVKVEGQAKTVKAMLRAAIAESRAPSEATSHPTLRSEDFTKMDDDIS